MADDATRAIEYKKNLKQEQDQETRQTLEADLAWRTFQKKQEEANQAEAARLTAEKNKNKKKSEAEAARLAAEKKQKEEARQARET